MSRPESGERHVIARHPNGGIGDHLSCLIGAWWFAKRTHRTLVIDWRGSRFAAGLPSTEHAFTHLFESVSTLAGVPVICDERVGQLSYSGPFFPVKWTAANLRGTEHVKHTGQEIAAVNALVTSELDVPAPVVAFNQWIDPPPPKSEVQRLLKDLRFHPDIRARADAIWSQALGQRPGIAIHIRHGNGENIGLRAAYWLDAIRWIRQYRANQNVDVHRPGDHGRFGDNMPPSLIRTHEMKGAELRFLTHIAREVSRMAKRHPGARPVLFCDSPVVASAMAQLLPDVLVPPKAFLPPDAGPLHAQAITGTGDMAQSTLEMAVELELMRRCSALVCMDSGFSIFAKAQLADDDICLLRPHWVNEWLMKVLRRL